MGISLLTISLSGGPTVLQGYQSSLSPCRTHDVAFLLAIPYEIVAHNVFVPMARLIVSLIFA